MKFFPRYRVIEVWIGLSASVVNLRAFDWFKITKDNHASYSKFNMLILIYTIFFYLQCVEVFGDSWCWDTSHVFQFFGKKIRWGNKASCYYKIFLGESEDTSAWNNFVIFFFAENGASRRFRIICYFKHFIFYLMLILYICTINICVLPGNIHEHAHTKFLP